MKKTTLRLVDFQHPAKAEQRRLDDDDGSDADGLSDAGNSVGNDDPSSSNSASSHSNKNTKDKGTALDVGREESTWLCVSRFLIAAVITAAAAATSYVVYTTGRENEIKTFETRVSFTFFQLLAILCETLAGFSRVTHINFILSSSGPALSSFPNRKSSMILPNKPWQFHK